MLKNEKCFNSIHLSAKQKILDGIGVEEYKINDSNFSKFDKYFTDFRPQFMKYEKILDEIYSNFKKEIIEARGNILVSNNLIFGCRNP